MSIPGADERRRDPNWPEHLLTFREEYPEGCIVKRQLGVSKGCAVMQVQIYLNQSDARPTADAISCCYATGQLSPYIQMAQDDALSQAFFELGSAAVTKSRKRRPKAAQQPAESKPAAEAQTEVEAPGPQEQAAAETAGPPVQADEGAHKVIPMKEPQEAAEPEPPKFSADMSVDEIYARISAEEAEKVPIPTGNYKGKLLGEITKQVPGMLAYYVTLSGTGDNLFHAAVKKLYEAQEQRSLAG